VWAWWLIPPGWLQRRLRRDQAPCSQCRCRTAGGGGGQARTPRYARPVRCTCTCRLAASPRLCETPTRSGSREGEGRTLAAHRTADGSSQWVMPDCRRSGSPRARLLARCRVAQPTSDQPSSAAAHIACAPRIGEAITRGTSAIQLPARELPAPWRWQCRPSGCMRCVGGWRGRSGAGQARSPMFFGCRAPAGHSGPGDRLG
jgi:hypothetical protein